MGLQVSYTHAGFGVGFGTAYVRLESIRAGSIIDPETGALVRGPLVAGFTIYVDKAARDGLRDPIGTVSVKVPYASVDWSAALAPQAWAALKARAEYAAGVDVID